MGAALDLGGCGEEIGGELGRGFQAEEGEGETLADAEVRGGQDVGATKAEHQEHFDGPFTDAADLGEVVDEVLVGHLTDFGQGGDGAVQGFGREVTEGQGFIGGEAGGAEAFVGGVEEQFRGGVVEESDGGVRGKVWREAADEAFLDGAGRVAVELLIDDGAG